MATDPNAIRAAQAGKTVTTSDGYEVTYDDSGVGRKSIAPDGTVKYYDSLGNQTTSEWAGNTPAPQQPVTPESNSTFVGPQEQLTEQGIPSGREMGVAYDDEGNLLPGWTKDPTGQYMTQTDPSYIDPATAAQAGADRAAYQNSQALDANGALKEGYTYDEFGTPVSKTTVDQQAVSNKADAGASDHGPAYDDDGNLMPGFTVNENGDAVWVEAGYNDATGVTAKPITDDPGVTDHGTPYDDEGNLNNGWSVNENGDAVWVGAGYNDATGVTAKPIKDEPVKADHGPAYDDDGNLMPGFTLNENGDAVWVGGGFVEPKVVASAKASREAAGIGVVPKPVLVKNDFQQKQDWRVRISLAPHASYLYKAAESPSDILFPLKATDGVIFPYTPSVSVNYAANYDATELAHTNYKMYQYKNSEVGAITITGVFTAQDNKQANYLLAVMHFFKSVTKMFYGQDKNPKNGTPPPLCYLSGFGAYQFDNHPLAVTSFNMSLPDDVDYIRAGKVSGYNVTAGEPDKSSKSSSWWDTVKARLKSSRLNKGGMKNEPVFTNLSNREATYVPTKMTITITCVPIVTRNDISNNFSLEQYAKGTLTRGSKRPTGGGGIW